MPYAAQGVKGIDDDDDDDECSKMLLAGGGVNGADGAECGDVARGGCLFACNLCVTRSAELTGAERRTRPNMASLHK